MDVKVGFAFIKITAYPYKIKCGTALKEYNTHVQLCNQSIHSTTQNEKPLYIYIYILCVSGFGNAFAVVVLLPIHLAKYI